jgi:phage-related protein
VNLRFYQNARGDIPVREHLRAATKEQRLLAGFAIWIIQDRDLSDPRLDLKPVRGKLWEIRAGYTRIFYVVAPGPVVVLLHAYQKDTDRAPEREVQVALRRMAETLPKRPGR